MTLDEFNKMVTYKDQEKEMHKYFDETITLHSILNNITDILIDLGEDKKGCYYTLRSVSDVNLSHMVEFYNDLKVNFFSRKFTVEAEMHRDIIYIRFIEKGIA